MQSPLVTWSKTPVTIIMLYSTGQTDNNRFKVLSVRNDITQRNKINTCTPITKLIKIYIKTPCTPWELTQNPVSLQDHVTATTVSEFISNARAPPTTVNRYCTSIIPLNRLPTTSRAVLRCSSKYLLATNQCEQATNLNHPLNQAPISTCHDFTIPW